MKRASGEAASDLSTAGGTSTEEVAMGQAREGMDQITRAMTARPNQAAGGARSAEPAG